MIRRADADIDADDSAHDMAAAAVTGLQVSRRDRVTSAVHEGISKAPEEEPVPTSVVESRRGSSRAASSCAPLAR